MVLTGCLSFQINKIAEGVEFREVGFGSGRSARQPARSGELKVDRGRKRSDVKMSDSDVERESGNRQDLENGKWIEVLNETESQDR